MLLLLLLNLGLQQAHKAVRSVHPGDPRAKEIAETAPNRLSPVLETNSAWNRPDSLILRLALSELEVR